MTNTITGNDTFTVYDRNITDLADDDVSTITFPNESIMGKTGKGGNTIFAQNAPGRNVNAVLRVLKGSADDIFLQSKITQREKDFVGTNLANGSFVKRINVEGQIRFDTYTLRGGVITRGVDGKENTSGDTSQGVAVYNFMFAEGKRTIQ